MLKVNPEGKTFKIKKVKEDEILKILKNLKASKLAGIDNVPQRMIRDTAEELYKSLSHLVNLSIQTSMFPNTEKSCKVTPIFKSGDPSNIVNYRPITVTPVLSKVLGKVSFDQLSTYLDSNKLLSPHQFGFRQGRSTQHAVTLLRDRINLNIDKGLCTGVVYMDLRKSFDTVCHSTLLQKLSHYEIHDKELNLISDYLFNRKQYVLYDNVKSYGEKVTCGVPQGSIVGPLLFGIMINDFHQVLYKTNTILYADDTVIYCAAKNSKDIEHFLNHDLKNVESWLDCNNLYINL